MAAVLLSAGDVPGQAPRPGDAPGFLPLASSGDEMSPRLIQGAKGEVLRLWERRAEQRTGGGAVILASFSPPDTWRTLVEVRSSEKGVTLRDPALAISPSGELALIYRWWRSEPRSKQLRLARSDDAGKTWSQPATPIDTSGKTFDPSIVWGPARSLVAVWADERRGGRVFDVYARRSPDGGASWEPEQLLSRFPALLPTDVFSGPKLIGDGQGALWVVWVGVKNGRSSVFMNRSPDAGRTWTDPVPLTGNSQSVFGYSLHRAGDRMLLVWHDTRTGRDRLYAVSSSDAGATWTAPVRVDHLPADAAVDTSSPTAVLNADGEALVAWEDPRNGRHDIFLARSPDGGRTWGTEDRRMETDDPGTAVSRYPRLARAGDGRVALVWEDDRAGFEGVYLRVRSVAEKAEWGAELRVSAPAPQRASRVPQALWAPDGLLHVAWEVWDHSPTAAGSKRVDGTTLRLDKP